jgi:hypothetical protein
MMAPLSSGELQISAGGGLLRACLRSVRDLTLHCRMVGSPGPLAMA